ncbi:diphosphomevalonate/mevalonate 3,5-bisphosphate decarboxylase family protein [Portibacter lacus]|uniref:Diphosphomevalonate decarboxylase n=1 Tax=Portibacter lacus TaxID=1099794 RepID=A0AA37SSP1_9BACT|nr:diphosphomevalonate decarboxylase [Portibacter lacus]GLR18925.1 diphosphomevalonate decarboxylase [Portibacter lacus]
MENYNQLRLGTTDKVKGKVTWSSPSNLAIIKYWGKHGIQLPNNPSISFTLTNAVSKTTVEYSARETYDGSIDVNFIFDGFENDAFKDRIKKYLNSIKAYVPFVEQLHFNITSENTFPHSSGIASSASAMSAIALSICSIEDELFKSLSDINDFERKASMLARLGSGSASRSIFDSWALWGKTGDVEGSSDEYAIGMKDHVHPIFHNLHDDICILSADEKSVSSSAGHALMDTNPYAPTRYDEAKRQLFYLLEALKQGNFERFGAIAEQEAMSLHALMMVSNPSYILMVPNTLAVIKKIRDFRKESGLPVYFSLDAGPNIHLLYPDHIADQLIDFIENEIRPLCVNGIIISDKVGPGPEQLD